MPKIYKRFLLRIMDTKTAIINKLSKFRLVDKYTTFHEAMPHSFSASPFQQQLVSEILNNCAKELIQLFIAAKKLPFKTPLKKVLHIHMELIAHADLDAANKEFAYKLCWYLSEKVSVNLSKQTAKKYWGYWEVVENEVKTVQYRKPRKLSLPGKELKKY